MKTIKITDTAKLSTCQMMASLKKTFEVYSYWNDEQLDKEFPKPKKSTTRHFKIEQECSDMKGLSWNDMKDNRECMMTFREYILYFAAYYKETGEYPDKDGLTLLKDGLLSDGYVACGLWSPVSRLVRFCWDRPDYRYSDSGARVAISLSSSNLNPSIPLNLDLVSRIESLEQSIEEMKKKLNSVVF